MIVAVLDDLMFTSKIRAAAAGLGVTVTFARSAEAALAALRAAETASGSAPSPTLVLIDLNGSATDPLGVVTAIRAVDTLRDVPIVGFVSHVQTELIDAARRAGTTDVVSRSAFVQRLPELLTRTV
jgi:CheY-like chemotaxis protein